LDFFRGNISNRDRYESLVFLPKYFIVKDAEQSLKLTYKVDSVIGKGTFAAVRSGRNRETK
jgi:hypothetical protein